jgi:hypothetical protein
VGSSRRPLACHFRHPPTHGGKAMRGNRSPKWSVLFSSNIFYYSLICFTFRIPGVDIRDGEGNFSIVSFLTRRSSVCALDKASSNKNRFCSTQPNAHSQQFATNIFIRASSWSKIPDVIYSGLSIRVTRMIINTYKNDDAKA